MIFKWNVDKNKKIIQERNISFEEIQYEIEAGNLVDAKVNIKIEYKHQIKLLVLINNYIWEVPSIIIQDSPKIIYFVTAFKNRKENTSYWRKNHG